MTHNERITNGVLAGFFSVLAAASSAQQPPPDTSNVEVDPITCWWKTTAGAVRAGEAFGLTLTCSVLETESTKVVPDLSRLDPAVVQLPPFEILGGTHPGDLTVPGRRFIQYDYKLRVITEDAFGADVAVPTLEVTYRIESRVSGGDSVQGRDLSYQLPRTSVRMISIVPSDTTDIRETPAAGFGAIESRTSRANLFQTLSTMLFALAGFVALVMLVGAIRRRTAKAVVVHHHQPPRAIIAGASRELADVQRDSRGGWTPELAARALTAIRIVGSYATGRAVGQTEAAAGVVQLDGQLQVGGGFGRGKVFVSGSVTPESGRNVPGLADALQTLTLVRYGRKPEVTSDADEALAAGLRVARQQASAHSRLSEWAAALVASVVDVRKKIWA